jgi:uncharacterized protein YqhQ
MNYYDLINRIKSLENSVWRLTMSCEICKEKQVEINRILSAYKKDKKNMGITIAVLGFILLIVSSLGRDGVITILDAVLNKFL